MLSEACTHHLISDSSPVPPSQSLSFSFFIMVCFFSFGDFISQTPMFPLLFKTCLFPSHAHFRVVFKLPLAIWFLSSNCISNLQSASIFPHQSHSHSSLIESPVSTLEISIFPPTTIHHVSLVHRTSNPPSRWCFC